jgi:type I restriction enzyme R subunit
MATRKENGFSNPLNHGQESPCPCDVDSPFFNKYAETDTHRRNLPHWQQGHVWCFVTWRLADSLPKAKLDQWNTERNYWLKQHPQPWDEATEADYHEQFSNRIDAWLDQGVGSCLLREPAHAKSVAESLRHFAGDRYVLGSFVVMPNHVHVLLRPLGAYSLAEIVKSWKGFTAHEINKLRGGKGTLWQEEYWDRLVRNEKHFAKCEQYIHDNPVKAGLKAGEFIWSSAKGNGFSNPLCHGQESPCPCGEAQREV